MLIPNTELVERVINEFYAGKPLKEALRDCGVSRQVFYETIAEVAHLGDKYARARTANAHQHAEETVEIADTDLDPQRARNRIMARQWLAAKTAPKDYGDRLDLNLSGSVDLLAAINEGKSRLLPGRYPADIEDAQLVEPKAIASSATSDLKPVGSAKSDIAPDEDASGIPPVDPFS
jgi:hypothetical protein